MMNNTKTFKAILETVLLAVVSVVIIIPIFRGTGS